MWAGRRKRRTTDDRTDITPLLAQHGYHLCHAEPKYQNPQVQKYGVSPSGIASFAPPKSWITTEVFAAVGVHDFSRELPQLEALRILIAKTSESPGRIPALG